MRALRRIIPIAVALAGLGCDRNLEPYDPNEQPRQPDLSKIFPAGAERAERAQPGLAPVPGMEERGTQAVAEAGEPKRQPGASEASEKQMPGMDMPGMKHDHH